MLLYSCIFLFLVLGTCSFYFYPNLDLDFANYFFAAPIDQYPTKITTEDFAFIKTIHTFFGDTLMNANSAAASNSTNSAANFTGGFYLKDVWFFDSFLHQHLKHFLIACMVLFFVYQILKIKQMQKFSLNQQEIKFAYHKIIASVFAIAISTILVNISKNYSVHACPWDLAIYGQAKGLPWHDWSHIWTGSTQNGCFPAAHSMTGFVVMQLALIYRHFLNPAAALNNFQNIKKDMHIKTTANIVLLLGILLGLFLGLGQQMRGAHFFSHTIASLNISLLVFVLVDAYLWYLTKKYQHALFKKL